MRNVESLMSKILLRSYYIVARYKLQGHGHKVKTVGIYRKVLSLENTYVKYKSSSTHCTKVIGKVKVLEKWVKLQGQGHRVKIMVPGNVFSQGIFM